MHSSTKPLTSNAPLCLLQRGAPTRKPQAIRGDVRAAATAAPTSTPNVVEICEPKLVKDFNGVDRLELSLDGWNQWSWRGHKINFIQAGDSGEPLVLIHGFGASSYHWRYNIFELAKSHRVFAVDLLGYGFSEKVVTDYRGAELWSEQIRDFLKEVVGGDSPAVLVGNSLGGYLSLVVAAWNPDLVKGVVCLNAAGYFQDDAKKVEEEKSMVEEWWDGVVKAFQETFKRWVILFSFYSTKNRVKQVLEQVYLATENVDEELVRSILVPAEDPNAAEVFYRTVSGSVLDNRVPLDQVLKELKVPLFLLWGDKDPWILPSKADKIMSLYEDSVKVGLNAGHCPHDEVPSQVNDEIKKWVASL